MRAVRILLFVGCLASAAEAQHVAVEAQPHEIDLTFESSAPAMSDALRDCIQANAAKVEAAAEPVLASIDLLVTKICAGPLAEIGWQQHAATQAKYKAQMTKMCERTQAQAKTDEERAAASYCDEDILGGWAIFTPVPSTVPADATALAANLILQLRTQRLEAKPQ